MIVQLLVRDKRLEDVTMDRGFLHVSEIGPACDEVRVCIKQLQGAMLRVLGLETRFVVHSPEITFEEFW